jgi:hypothetical protein
MRQAPLRTISRAVAFGLCVLLCGSCGTVVRQGRGASYLTIDMLSAASGATPGEFGNVLQSDVITNVKVPGGGVAPTILEDNGQAIFRMALKDISTPSGPTTNNEITITGFRVTFTRADGRNTPGVDVPYPFDGAVTGTVKVDLQTTLHFVIVRAQAKLEAPLAALRGMGGAVIISTIAEVTFYGHDQVGNQVNVTGTISVNFADWADPSS